MLPCEMENEKMKMLPAEKEDKTSAAKEGGEGGPTPGRFGSRSCGREKRSREKAPENLKDELGRGISSKWRQGPLFCFSLAVVVGFGEGRSCSLIHRWLAHFHFRPRRKVWIFVWRGLELLEGKGILFCVATIVVGSPSEEVFFGGPPLSPAHCGSVLIPSFWISPRRLFLLVGFGLRFFTFLFRVFGVSGLVVVKNNNQTAHGEVPRTKFGLLPSSNHLGRLRSRFFSSHFRKNQKVKQNATFGMAWSRSARSLRSTACCTFAARSGRGGGAASPPAPDRQRRKITAARQPDPRQLPSLLWRRRFGDAPGASA